MFKAAVGFSEDSLIEEAVREVIEQVRREMGDIVPQAGLLFCSLDFDHSYIISQIRAEFPSIQLAGCTTDGEMSSVNGFSEDSIVLMVFASDRCDISAGIGKGTAADGKSAGRTAALNAKNGLKKCQGEEKFAIILMDPLNAGTSEMNQGIEEVLGVNFPFIGAATAAHSKKRTTKQFCNDEIATDSVVLLLFSGPVTFSCGIQGGHSPMGPKEIVTSVDKNIIYRIGDKPALEYLQRYIGENYSIFMNYCIAVFEKGRDSFYVRSAPFSDRETGSITLNGVVPKGSMVQIGTADKDTCIESCEKSLKIALDSYHGGRPAAAVHFSCAGRKMMLGTQIVKEAQTVEKHIAGIPYCGFYAYGEIGPLEKGSKSLFHGTTFVTLLIGEAE